MSCLLPTRKSWAHFPLSPAATGAGPPQQCAGWTHRLQLLGAVSDPAPSSDPVAGLRQESSKSHEKIRLLFKLLFFFFFFPFPFLFSSSSPSFSSSSPLPSPPLPPSPSPLPLQHHGAVAPPPSRTTPSQGVLRFMLRVRHDE